MRKKTPANQSQNSNILIYDVEETFVQCLDILKRKNHDYAGKDTPDPYKNFKNVNVVGVNVEKGILVRIMDKITRISNLTEHEAQVKDESIQDTLSDLINYSAILKSYLKNKNGKATK